MPSRRYRPLLGCDWDWVGVVSNWPWDWFGDGNTSLSAFTNLREKPPQKIRRYSAIWNNTEPVSNGNVKMYVQ